MQNLVKIKKPYGVSIQQRIETYTFYSPDGCWYWFGHLVVYKELFRPVLNINGKLCRVARIVYGLRHGIQLNDPKILVCHTCDNPICINPDHLFLGSHKDNTHDMFRKGRSKFNTFRRGFEDSQKRSSKNRIFKQMIDGNLFQWLKTKI